MFISLYTKFIQIKKNIFANNLHTGTKYFVKIFNLTHWNYLCAYLHLQIGFNIMSILVEW